MVPRRRAATTAGRAGGSCGAGGRSPTAPSRAMMPCWTPTNTTVAAVTTRDPELDPAAGARSSRMPATSMSRTAIRNTTDDEHGVRQVRQRPGQEQQHDRDDDRREELGELRSARRRCRPSRSSSGCRSRRTCRRARPTTLAAARPTRSAFSSKRSPNVAAYAREVAALWARITTKIEAAVPSSAATSLQRDVGQADARAGRSAPCRRW